MDNNEMQGFFANAKALPGLLCGLMLALAGGASVAQEPLPVRESSAAVEPGDAVKTGQMSAKPAGPEAAPPQAEGRMTKERLEELEARAPLNQRYPAGSIKSVEAAQKALDEAAEDREALEVRYILDQRTCYKKFLVSGCLEVAKDRKRLAEKGIKQVENEANTYQRQATVDERDRALAEQRVKDEEDAARRLQDQKQKEADSARKVQESSAKNQEVQQRIDQNKGVPADYRVREHEARVRQQQTEEAARAPERAANAAAREQRIKEAEEHRLEVKRKKAENERERAERKKRQEPDSSTAAPTAR